ncbi:MAG: hypothetical protein MK135_05995 [Polyangiaceae bacterium]|nr:hypothetical protein [Polyangiaceae bacterium]
MFCLFPLSVGAADAEQGAASASFPGAEEPEATGEQTEEPSKDAPASEPPAAGVAKDAGDASATPQPQSKESSIDGATYQVRLRDLEQKVDALKEQIRRSHTRLSLLSDTILSGASGGARAEIAFVNRFSSAWKLVEAVFVLDGAVQYKKTDDTGVLADQKRIPIFSGSVPAGDHTLQVMLKLQGQGFGVFSYMRGIEATVKSSHSFTLSEGKVMALTATSYEKGGPTTPVQEQPDIHFRESLSNMTRRTNSGSGGTSLTTGIVDPSPRQSSKQPKSSKSTGAAAGSK